MHVHYQKKLKIKDINNFLKIYCFGLKRETDSGQLMTKEALQIFGEQN